MKTLELSKVHLPFEDLLLNDDEMLVIKGGMAMRAGNTGCHCGCSGKGCTPGNTGCNCECTGEGCIPPDPENTPSPTPKPGSVIC